MLLITSAILRKDKRVNLQFTTINQFFSFTFNENLSARKYQPLTRISHRRTRLRDSDLIKPVSLFTINFFVVVCFDTLLMSGWVGITHPHTTLNQTILLARVIYKLDSNSLISIRAYGARRLLLIVSMCVYGTHQLVSVLKMIIDRKQK